MIQEIEGRTTVSCDWCTEKLVPILDTDGENLQAKFNDSKGNPKDHAFCNRNCLRLWLNYKHKQLKSKASFNKGVWELEFTPTEEFSQSALWPKK